MKSCKSNLIESFSPLFMLVCCGTFAFTVDSKWSSRIQESFYPWHPVTSMWRIKQTIITGCHPINFKRYIELQHYSNLHYIFIAAFLTSVNQSHTYLPPLVLVNLLKSLFLESVLGEVSGLLSSDAYRHLYIGLDFHWECDANHTPWRPIYGSPNHPSKIKVRVACLWRTQSIQSFKLP